MSIQSLSYQIVCFYSRTRSFVNCVEKLRKTSCRSWRNEAGIQSHIYNIFQIYYSWNYANHLKYLLYAVYRLMKYTGKNTAQCAECVPTQLGKLFHCLYFLIVLKHKALKAIGIFSERVY